MSSSSAGAPTSPASRTGGRGDARGRPRAAGQPAGPRAAAASGSGSTACRAGRRPSPTAFGSSSSHPRRCSSSRAPRASGGPPSTAWPRVASRPTRRPSRRTDGRSSSATASFGRSARTAPGALSCAYWDKPFLDAGGEVVEARLELLGELAEPLAAAHAEIAPEEAARSALRMAYETNAPARAGESPGMPWPAASPRLPRRRSGTAPRSSGPTATTCPSPSRAGTSPASPRGASSGRRSLPSSSPSSTS